MLRVKRPRRIDAWIALGSAFVALLVAAGVAAAPMVVGGTPAPRGTFDEVVLVGRRGIYHCSGVLVGTRHVLTARHCLPADRVLFGVAVDDEQASTIAVEASSTPPQRSMDVGLLHLARPAPVAPARRRAANAALAGIVSIVGFGANDEEGRRGFGRKRFAEVTARGWGCNDRTARKLGCLEDVELVLASAARRDSCSGDSGGGVFERMPDGFRLIAITSRAVADTCGVGGIYVRVDAIDDWLNETLEDE